MLSAVPNVFSSSTSKSPMPKDRFSIYVTDTAVAMDTRIITSRCIVFLSYFNIL